MKFLRWTVYCPLSIAAFIICLQVVPFILGWIYKIAYILMFSGSKYDVPPILDFEYAIMDFKNFIFVTCLGTIISGGISGALAGYIAPKSQKTEIAAIVYAIFLFGILALFGIAAWNTEHWFYSLCMEITLLITVFVGFVSMLICNSEK